MTLKPFSGTSESLASIQSKLKATITMSAPSMAIK